MILFHCSPCDNETTIRALGLDLDFCQTAVHAIWLVTHSRLNWALRHASTRHNVAPDEIDVWRVRVSRRKVARYGRGIWLSRVDVPPSALTLTLHDGITGMRRRA